jgi:hypothetical protein
MANMFQTRNPQVLSLAGSSSVPIPDNHNDIIPFGGGPIPNTAYILWKRDIEILPENAEKNPTKKNHKGWTVVAKGIFQGWERQQVGSDVWHPIMLPVVNPSLTAAQLKDTIEFHRIVRNRYDRRDPDRWIGAYPTNKIVTDLYWQKIMKPSEHEDLFVKRGTARGGILAKMVKSHGIGDLGKGGDDVFTNIMSYGGRKRQRKKKTTKRKITKSKTQRKNKKVKSGRKIKKSNTRRKNH